MVKSEKQVQQLVVVSQGHCQLVVVRAFDTTRTFDPTRWSAPPPYLRVKCSDHYVVILLTTTSSCHEDVIARVVITTTLVDGPLNTIGYVNSL
jgi:hypothetical protein